jgi:arylsulfatase A-like enzyme
VAEDGEKEQDLPRARLSARPPRSQLWTDAQTAANAALLGVLCMALVDLVATWWSAPGSVAFGTLLRLVLVEVALGLVAFLPIAFLFFLLAGGSRVAWVLLSRDEDVFPGVFAPAVIDARFYRAAPRIWSACIGIGLYVAGSTLLTLQLLVRFKEPQLTALLAAVLQIGLLVAIALLCFGINRLLTRVGMRLSERLGRLNPFGNPLAAALTVVLLFIPTVKITSLYMPQLEPLVPWRLLIAAAAVALGAYGYKVLLAFRGRLWPAAGKRRRIAALATAGAVLLLEPLVLLKIGAHPDTRGLMVSSSPPLDAISDLIRKANDFDGDTFGSLLGENDCGPFDANIHPLARDIPDNGIDENCDGHDFKLGKIPSYRSGEHMPVPDAYLEDWNIILLTVDTLRYDHTGFGGYKRGTSPELDRLVKRSVSFAFANAPSAGTMASVPAILTSKFFHSGIALDENVKRGMPPKLKPENLLLSEVLKDAGYRTGAILTHEYFNDWGMEQGFDLYDNEIGAKHNPRSITSDKLTDRAIKWIGSQRSKKWFLWLHYLDPHGRYVEHPEGPPYGTTEMDLYDGEIHFTDKHIGRLLDYIAHSPAGNKTIIALTSDHGDAFNEHGYINHGQDLHRELLHVPLIIYVPNIEPRVVQGPVSPIDVFPTLVDLAGGDSSKLDIEGESLVPQLFYKRDANDRVVFSETNWPKPLRAVVNSRYKLIHNIKANVSRLFDLKKDPWEKKNIWTKDKQAYNKMRGYLSEWLERVYYSRDATSNQAMNKLGKFLVKVLPDTAHRIEGVMVEPEKLEVGGLEAVPQLAKAGTKVELAVYLHPRAKPAVDYKLQLVLWPDNPRATPAKTQSRLRVTGDGIFGSSHWRPNEIVVDRFKVNVPKTWGVPGKESTVFVGLRFVPPAGPPPQVSGPKQPTAPDVTLIGSFRLAPGGPAAPAPPAPRPLKGVKGAAVPAKPARPLKPAP